MARNLEPGGGGGRARHHGGGPRGREADRAAGGATPPLRHAPGRQVSVTAEEDTNGVDVLGEDNPREVILPLVQHLPLETQQVLLPRPYQQPDNFVVYPIVDLKEQIFTVDICRYLFLTNDIYLEQFSELYRRAAVLRPLAAVEDDLAHVANVPAHLGLARGGAHRGCGVLVRLAVVGVILAADQTFELLLECVEGRCRYLSIVYLSNLVVSVREWIQSLFLSVTVRKL